MGENEAGQNHTRLADSATLSEDARVAESADATDLKSVFAKAECGFKSRPGHHFFNNLTR